MQQRTQGDDRKLVIKMQIAILQRCMNFCLLDHSISRRLEAPVAEWLALNQPIEGIAYDCSLALALESTDQATVVQGQPVFAAWRGHCTDCRCVQGFHPRVTDRKSTRLNSSHWE